jgi:polysaccharide biosynthesis/export protein
LQFPLFTTMNMICRFGVALGALAAMVAMASSATAQYGSAGNPAALHATRAELEQLLVDFETRNAPGATGSEEQIRSRAEAALIRNRLQDGDFQTGDQIVLRVELHPDLSDTYTVEPTRSIALPAIGSVPLRGVLRSELEAHLAEYLSQYVRDPRVRAQSTIRIMVLGAVGSPGFYSVPSHALVTDVIASAGGTGRQARLTDIRIERDGQRIAGGRPLRDAIVAGRTLDQLNVRAGDRVVVPEHRGAQVREIMGWTGSIVGLVLTVLYLTRR